MADIQFPSPEQIAALSPEELAKVLNSPNGTLGHKLGIELLYIDAQKVVARMPVAGNTQPAGRLHGGANIALAEELASIGTWVNLDISKQVAVGVDINATHVRGVSSGYVTATATRSHKGRSLYVWEVVIADEKGKTTCLSRCTCSVIPR